ncbi:MAG: hypothetical protein HKL95_04120 [Phycisphaerae bacterium]|nr:hypothetical protein [Phycisphaerae bacterium]
MKDFIFGGILCLSAVPLMAATASGSTDTASAVLGYQFGTPYTSSSGYSYYNGYDNASAALGPIQSDTSGGYGPDPFLPAWDTSQLTIVAPGGSITLQMAQPVSGNGMLGVFTDVAINNVSTTVGSEPQASTPASTLSPFPEAIVSVGDGSKNAGGDYILVPLNGGNPITFENPTNYYTNSLVSVQSGPGYYYVQSSLGTQPADWTKPFLGNLASFNGETYSQMVATLDGSAGGTWLNLASAGLSQVDVVQFSVPTGATYHMTLDSVAAPEPNALELVGLGIVAMALMPRRARWRLL